MTTKAVKLTRAKYSKRLKAVLRLRTTKARCKALGELNREWNLRQGGAK